MELRLRGKSTSQSYRTPIYYVDLTVRAGMTLPAAVAAAITQRDEWKALGFDQTALDEASRKGFAAGVFEESAEEVEGVLEEFYPEPTNTSDIGQQPAKAAAGLADKLAGKVLATSAAGRGMARGAP